MHSWTHLWRKRGKCGSRQGRYADNNAGFVLLRELLNPVPLCCSVISWGQPPASVAGWDRVDAKVRQLELPVRYAPCRRC